MLSLLAHQAYNTVTEQYYMGEREVKVLGQKPCPVELLIQLHEENI